MDQYLRQTNTLKLLKIIGEFELSKPSFSSVPAVLLAYQQIKDGGIFSVSDLQLILPPTIGVTDVPSKSTPLLIVNSHHLRPAKLPSDAQNPAKSDAEPGIANSIHFLQTSETVSNEVSPAGLTVISRYHGGMSNAASVNSRTVRYDFVVLHNRGDGRGVSCRAVGAARRAGVRAGAEEPNRELLRK